MRLALMSLAFVAFLAHAIEPPAAQEKADQLYALHFEMCDSSGKRCRQFPVTESTMSYQQFSKETCLALGKGLTILKINEGYDNSAPSVPLYKITCYDRLMQDINVKTYTDKDFQILNRQRGGA